MKIGMRWIFLSIGVLVVSGMGFAAAPPPETEPARIARLVQELGDDEFETRQAASEALRALGDKAQPALNVARKHKDPEIRWREFKLWQPPKAFDSRAVMKTVPPIKNQKECGAPYAFVMTAAMEFALQMHEGVSADLSEQFLISCNMEHGCGGGSYIADFTTREGFVLTKSFPYEAKDVPCKRGLPVFRTPAAWHWVGGTSTGDYLKELKTAILEHGSVTSRFYAAAAFGEYKGGIFKGCGAAEDPNTMVNLVGWDDADQYWIVRNSWGPAWGEKGYAKVPYECNGIATGTMYVELKKK